MTRKPLSKRLRFQVFARDGFTCRYCGATSETVTLHVDHVIPVSKGGSDAPENLVTACAACNLGKADKVIHNASAAIDHLRMAQELAEQKEAAKAAAKALRARRRRMKKLEDFWLQTTQRTRFDKPTLATIFVYLERYGEELVYRWIEKAGFKCSSDVQMGRYISGIRRCHEKEMEAEQ